MPLSEYDIQRLSSAIVNKLVNDDRFIDRMAKMLPKQERMLTSTQAADRLGLTRKTVCEIASSLGGVRSNTKSAHWVFPESTLVENYIRYKLTSTKKAPSH